MRGSVTSKCMKRHRNADKVCSSRCLRWYYVIDARDQQGGRRRQWSTGYPTKKAAQQALTEELQRRQQGIVLEQAKITLREHVDRWLEHLAILGRDERTIERYAELLGLHVLPYLGGTPLRELTPLHLTDLYAMLLREGRKDGRPGGLAPRTVEHVHRAVHRSLRQAVRWRLVPRNPAADLAEEGLPSIPRSPMVTLSRDQAAMLLKEAQQRPLIRSLVTLGVATSARLGELLALTWNDIDLEAGTLRIGRSRRIVNRQMQVKGPKTEAGHRNLILGSNTITALKQLRSTQEEHRRLLGAAYYADEDLRRAGAHLDQVLGEVGSNTADGIEVD
jgi:integrase